MRARTRRSLTAVSVLWIGVVVWLFPRVPLQVFNVLLVTVVVPWVWLLWAFCRASAHQHADKWARAVDKVHNGGRPRPLPSVGAR